MSCFLLLVSFIEMHIFIFPTSASNGTHSIFNDHGVPVWDKSAIGLTRTHKLNGGRLEKPDPK